MLASRRQGMSEHRGRSAEPIRRVAPRIPEALALPSLNRGSAFTSEVPPEVSPLEDQALWARQRLQELPTDLACNLLLEQGRIRDEAVSRDDR